MFSRAWLIKADQHCDFVTTFPEEEDTTIDTTRSASTWATVSHPIPEPTARLILEKDWV